MLAQQLFPRVRAGLSYAKNYVMRRPYGPEREYVTSKTGLDSGQATRPKLTEEAIRQWGVPELNSKKDAVRWDLHKIAMERVIRTQPPVQIKSLTEHVLRHGAWGLGEKGASWLAEEFSKDSRAREALLDAYTSPEMSSFVTEGSKAGLIRNRAWTNSALVIHGKPIEAGKHLYASLRNSMLFRGRLEDMLERAKQMDSEAARPAAQPAQEGRPEVPERLPEPENGKSYTIGELREIAGWFGGAGQPITITNSPVFRNNPQNYNAQQSGSGVIVQGGNRRRFIGMLGIPHRENGFRGYDGRFVDVEGKRTRKPRNPALRDFRELLKEYKRQNERASLLGKVAYLADPGVRQKIGDEIANPDFRRKLRDEMARQKRGRKTKNS
jgi:hypothetical protein